MEGNGRARVGGDMKYVRPLERWKKQAHMVMRFAELFFNKENIRRSPGKFHENLRNAEARGWIIRWWKMAIDYFEA